MNYDQIIAVVRLICPLLATSLALIGIEVDANAIMVGVLLAVALGAFIWAWWKNNNVTLAAQEAQKYLTVLKADHIDRKDDGDTPAEIDEH